jgi:hypothetical protein
MILQVTLPSPASRASTVNRFFLPKITFSAALLTNLHLFASPETLDVKTNGEPSISLPAYWTEMLNRKMKINRGYLSYLK